MRFWLVQMRAFVVPAIRDVAALSLTVGLLTLDARLWSADAGAAAIAVAIVAGVMVTLVSFLLHEWGHWLGAVASGSPVSRPPGVLSPFLFHFDTQRSTRKQFLWMSMGGYAASALALAAIATWADFSRLSGLVAFGLASLGVLVTLVLEVPTTVRVLRGAPLPRGGVYETQ